MTASILDTDVVATTGASSATSKSMSWSSGDVVICYNNGRDNAGTISSMTTTGSGLSFSAQEANTTVGRTQGGLYTAVATASSSGTITCTFTQAMDSSQTHFVIVQDADTIEDSNVTTSTTTSISTTVTPTSSDTLILGFGGCGSGTANFTAGSGYTFLSGHEDISSGTGGSASESGIEENNETSTSAVTVDFTLGTARQSVMFAMAIGTASAGAATGYMTTNRGFWGT